MFVFQKLLAIGLWLGSASAASLGVVYTEGGMVEGKNHNMGFRRSVDAFKGIPFADQPVRFQKPQPHPGWEGVLTATQYRDRCLQVTTMKSGTQGSEDCLYLNIFVPQGQEVSTGLPVMVYLYGGAFRLGLTNDASFLGESLYDGKEMADRGKVIVVTINYRVGTLGFLSTGDATIPGNYGLWDQHAAIAWVHRNILAFGGDPNLITIFGQSAGAASVNFQMLSPYNKGLFKRAISQSGVALSPWALQTNPLDLAKLIATKVACPTDETMATCLRITDPAILTKAGKLALSEMGKGPVFDQFEHSPVVDGDFIPLHPSKLFKNAANIDYLAGVNNMDGHLFASIDVPSIDKKYTTTTPEEIKALLAGLTREKGPGAVESAYTVYTEPWGIEPPKQEVVKKLAADIETDFLFLAPTQDALNLHARAARGTALTYSYLFNMGTRMSGVPSWVEAEHGDDVQYVFGKPFDSILGYLPSHRTLAEIMIAYWTNFALTGDPSTGNSEVPVKWPAFTSLGRRYLRLNNRTKWYSVKSNLNADFVRYWTITYPKLPSVTTQA